jgi:TetR/AcrR family transcriptional regulator, transcriptional repressor for nem operon
MSDVRCTPALCRKLLSVIVQAYIVHLTSYLQGEKNIFAKETNWFYFYAAMLTKGDKTRQFIIEKSAPIFNRKGYAATSMADILKATGLAKGGVYGNFSSKDEIAIEAFDYSYSQLKEQLRFKIRQEKTSTGKLTAILDFYRNYSIKPHIEGGCPLQNTAIDADDNIPFLKEKAKTALEEMLDTLRYLIQSGIDHKEFRKDMDATREAELFFAKIEGAIMMSKLRDNPRTLNRILDEMKEEVSVSWKS